jgi:mRNA-degrading endonuclease RelE of RelBE toxin-antitoxin system
MVEIRFDKKFKKLFSKLDDFMKQKIIKQIGKVSENPEIGKPMKYGRKGTRELYVGSFRFSYVFVKEENVIYVLDLYHKNKQ